MASRKRANRLPCFPTIPHAIGQVETLYGTGIGLCPAQLSDDVRQFPFAEISRISFPPSPMFDHLMDRLGRPFARNQRNQQLALRIQGIGIPVIARLFRFIFLRQMRLFFPYI